MTDIADEMIESWLVTLPPKTRKSAKSDIRKALNGVDGDVFGRARTEPVELLSELDRNLQTFGRYNGPTRNKIKSVLRRWLRFHGIETLRGG